MRFDTISPIDGRYAEDAAVLQDYFTEEAFIKYMLAVEIALLDEHCKAHGYDILPRTTFFGIKAEEVYKEEQKTHHQVKALVNVIQRRIADDRACYVHLGITSSDTQDTANVLRIRDAVEEVILPELKELERQLIKKMQKYATTKQIGRTHGQHAIPMTFGWWWAEYVSRLGECVYRIEETIPRRGQMSGAVGNYAALSYIYKDPVGFAERVLKRVGLGRVEYSSQIIPADGMVRFLNEVNVCFGVLANLADDIRHLQRTEIAEVREEFTDEQVGSSTMPQKRNPWNCEHVKSLWKEYMPRFITFNMDLISEHQRDLTNSASSRFIPEYLTGFYLAVSRTLDIVTGLQVNEEKMAFRCTNSCTAEQAYILLACSGVKDAHEVVRKLTLQAEQEQKTFEAILRESEWWPLLRGRLEEPRDVAQGIMFNLERRYSKGLLVLGEEEKEDGD